MKYNPAVGEYYIGVKCGDLRTLPVVDGVGGRERMSPFLSHCKHKPYSQTPAVTSVFKSNIFTRWL